MAEVVGLAELLKRIARVQANINNPGKPLKDSADHQLDSLDKNFDVGGRPRWQPLGANTLRRKKGSILDESGDMRGANKPEMEGSGWSIINTDWKAPFHLTGTEVDGEEHIPARNWLVYQPEDVTTIGSLFMDHIFS
ncbi:MAG TPA: hypothetical protein VF543_22410 [Pyrinomonadaceae bacterium]|jgi:phage gpG-like protein